jgi:hypothetical protein
MPPSLSGEYQQKAEECLVNAVRVPGSAEKAEWLNLAESWLRMAAEARRVMLSSGSATRVRNLQRATRQGEPAGQKVWRASCCSVRALHSVQRRAPHF